jgi:transposase
MPTNSPNPFPARPTNLKGVALKNAEKTWLANEVLLTKTPCKNVAATYNIARTTLQGWVKSVKNGVMQHLTPGRPPRVDVEAMAEVAAQVTDQEYQVPVEDFKKLLYKKAVESATKRGIPKSMVPPISRQTIATYEKNIGAKRKSSESTTWARADAQADIRNAVSFAVMNSLVVPLTEPDLIINSDATQYTVGGGAKRVQVIMIPRIPANEALKGPCPKSPMDVSLPVF